MQDFLSLCQARRSTRKYTAQPISQDKLDYILRCALMSPSGHRYNPWEFFVSTDAAKLRPLSACRTYGSGMFQTATGAIVLTVDTSLTDVWQFDAGIAGLNLLLAAEEQGLGACWCQVYGRMTDTSAVSSDGCASSDAPAEVPAELMIKQLWGIPEHLTVVCVISLGYKDEERRPFDLEKLPYQKIHNV